MAFDGSGNYNRVHNWQQDAANGLNISAPEMDGEDNSIAGAFNLAVTRDGQGKMTADFLPNTDNTLNLGSAIKRWASINGVPIPAATAPFAYYPAIAAEGTAGVTPTLFYWPPGNVLRYNAKGDGATDDTVAIQNAINVMQILCGKVYLPATTTSYKVTAPLNITAGMSLVGDGFSPYTPNDFNTRGPGSWIQFAHLGQGFVVNNGAANVTSVFLEKIGTIRNQAAPGAGWAPLAADYDIFCGNADLHIRDVMLWNPTKGIQINSGSGARLDIDGLFGQPLQMGINVVYALDVVRIRNVHFWPYWSNDVTYVQPYTLANLIPIQLERCDNPIISDFFCIYVKNGIVFTSNVNGFTQRAQLSNIGIDSMQSNAITILAGADGTSFTVNGIYGFAGSATCNGISNFANNCLIQASAARFSQLGFCASTINGTGNISKYTNWIVDGYNGANNGSVCFFTNGGCQTIISDKVTATATNAAPLINAASTNNYNAIAAQGAWSMVNPATSVVITHGLGWAPAAYQINLQFNSVPGSAYYLDTFTATQFTIHGAPPGTTNGTWTIDGRTP